MKVSNGYSSNCVLRGFWPKVIILKQLVGASLVACLLGSNHNCLEVGKVLAPAQE